MNNLKMIFVLIIALFFVALSSQSQPIKWQLMNGPCAGDAVNALAINSQGYIFNASQSGGLYRTTDFGKTWRAINSPLSNVRVNVLFIDPNDRIFACTENAGVYVSGDNGDTWTQSDTTINKLKVKSIAQKKNGLLLIGTEKGVYISSDNGMHWETRVNGLPIGIALSVGVNARGNLYASYRLTSGYSRMYISTDEGLNWTQDTTLLKYGIMCLINYRDQKLFALSGSACISYDDGATWKSLNRDGSVLTVSQQGTIYIAGDVFSRSTDDGVSWKMFDAPFKKYGTHSIYVRITALISDNTNHVIVGMEDGQIFLSQDDGVSWSKIDHSASDLERTGYLLCSKENVYLIIRNSLYKSTNYGETWESLLLNSQKFIITGIVVHSSGHIFLGDAYTGLVRSTDGGKSWEEKNAGIDTNLLSNFLITSSGKIVRVYSDSICYLSTDNGETWKLMGELPVKQVSVFTSDKNENLYIGSYFKEGVFRSRDYGSTWQNILNDPFVQVAHDFKLNFKGHMFVATGPSGVYRSTDDGKTWMRLFNGISGTYIDNLSINSKETIFAGSDGAGVFQSLDNGESWTNVNDGLFDRAIRSLAINDNDYLFADTPSGVFRTVDRTTSVKNISESPSSFYLGQNYPNPFTRNTIIDLPLLSGEGEGEVTFKIYDIFGRKVLDLSNRIDNGKLTIDNSQLTIPGVYFYRLTVGGESQTKKMVVVR